MLDGVELNDPISPSRSYDLAHLSLANIERIEILRGAQSTLYGSDALGGVINVITKKGKGNPRFRLLSLGGSYGTFLSNAEFGGSTDAFHYALAVSYLRSDGFSAAGSSYEGNQENDGYRNLTFSGIAGYRLWKNMEIDLTWRTLKTQSDIDNNGGAYGDDPNNIQHYNASLFNGQIRHLFLQNRWEQKLNISLIQYNREYNNPTDDAHPFDADHSTFESQQWKLDWQHNLFLHKTNTLSFGIEHQHEQGQSDYSSESLWGSFSTLFPQQEAYNTGIYVQDQIRGDDRFFATVGIRLDRHSQSGQAVTYRIAPAYLIEDTGTKLKGSYGTGFKSPSLYQLYAPETTWGPVGNKTLQPEQSTSWDLGIEQNLFRNRIRLCMTYFSSDYKNLIDFDSARGYINISKASSRGTEIFLLAKPTNRFRLRASYTHNEARDKVTNQYLLRRPKRKLTVRMYYDFSRKAHLTLSLLYMGKREDMEWSGWISQRVVMPSYTLLNASIVYDMTDETQIFLKLENLLDEEYEMIKGYGTAGFSLYGGLKVLF
jgi:vitamin B12 transporter